MKLVGWRGFQHNELFLNTSLKVEKCTKTKIVPQKQNFTVSDFGSNNKRHRFYLLFFYETETKTNIYMYILYFSQYWDTSAATHPPAQRCFELNSFKPEVWHHLWRQTSLGHFCRLEDATVLGRWVVYEAPGMGCEVVERVIVVEWLNLLIWFSWVEEDVWKSRVILGIFAI